MRNKNHLDDKTRFLRFLGLCRRAAKTIHGTTLVCEALSKRRPPYLVILSGGASDATQKKIVNKCKFYNVPLLIVDIETDALAQAVGKASELAAIGVADEGFARELCKIYAERKESPVGDEG